MLILKWEKFLKNNYKKNDKNDENYMNKRNIERIIFFINVYKEIFLNNSKYLIFIIKFILTRFIS